MLRFSVARLASVPKLVTNRAATTTSTMSFVTHLESALDGTHFPAGTLQTLDQQGRPLWVKYDLAAVRAALTKDMLKEREPTLWRYRELLPYAGKDDPVSLGEGMTPLLSCPRLARALNLRHLSIKDESQLPTGSFKSRGMALAVTMARELGVTRIALPSAGNAGGAAAAYGARAGMQVYVFMPSDTPVINQYECVLAGARTHVLTGGGLINHCGAIVKEGKPHMNWFDLSTLKEPYRIEGKKTMGLELAEQCQWKLPDVIFYPTGGGTGLIGMWKAFNELKEMGWLIDHESGAEGKLPRMVAVQSDGCCPIVTAFEANARFAEPHANAHTMASGLRVPVAVGDFMILDALRESHGCAVAVEEDKIRAWMELAVRSEGISVCPEAAACVGAIEKLLASGWLKPEEDVVIFNTGAAQKYVEAITPVSDIPTIELGATIDWEAMAKSANS